MQQKERDGHDQDEQREPFYLRPEHHPRSSRASVGRVPAQGLSMPVASSQIQSRSIPLRSLRRQQPMHEKPEDSPNSGTELRFAIEQEIGKQLAAEELDPRDAGADSGICQWCETEPASNASFLGETEKSRAVVTDVVRENMKSGRSERNVIPIRGADPSY